MFVVNIMVRMLLEVGLMRNNMVMCDIQVPGPPFISFVAYFQGDKVFT